MVKIKIYGKLSREIGINEVDAECCTVGDVMGHLCHITGGDFARKLMANRDEGVPYALFKNGQGSHIKREDALFEGDVLTVCPVLGMSGAFAVAYPILSQILLSLALSVAFSLLSMLLAPSPPQLMDGGPETKRKEAYLFDGRARTVNQGSCVPVGYGRMMVPGSVIYNRVNYVEI